MSDIDTSPEAVEEQASRCDEHAEQAHDAGALGWRDTLNDAAALLRQLVKEKAEARNAALEEARQVAWRLRYETGADVYNAIRLLKTPQTGVDRNAKAIGLAIDFTTGTAREVKE